MTKLAVGYVTAILIALPAFSAQRPPLPKARSNPDNSHFGTAARKISWARLKRRFSTMKPVPVHLGVYPAMYIEGTDSIAVACNVYTDAASLSSKGPGVNECASVLGSGKSNPLKASVQDQERDCTKGLVNDLETLKPLDVYPKSGSHLLGPLQGNLLPCKSQLWLDVPVAASSHNKRMFKSEPVWHVKYCKITLLSEGFIPKPSVSGPDITWIFTTITTGVTTLTSGGPIDTAKLGIALPAFGVGGFLLARMLYNHFGTSRSYYLVVNYSLKPKSKGKKCGKPSQSANSFPKGEAAAFALDMESFWPLAVILQSKTGVTMRALSPVSQGSKTPKPPTSGNSP